ncbi:hypothetical protein D3C77_401050 [compost metagenome]
MLLLDQFGREFAYGRNASIRLFLKHDAPYIADLMQKLVNLVIRLVRLERQTQTFAADFRHRLLIFQQILWNMGDRLQLTLQVHYSLIGAKVLHLAAFIVAENGHISAMPAFKRCP